MFGIGMPELIIILVIALVVIGPKKLPDLAKALGKGLSEFKKATSDIKEGLNLDEDFKEARNDLADAVSGLDEPSDLKKTEPVEEASPKFQDYDEMLDAYHQEKTLSSEKAEEAPTSTDAEKKAPPETPAEKDQDGK
ncbi:MAG: twin-arginine translocase TatA/TatE family subunit [Deltaproteobacteria bacterium]|nr:twin-arginine translocase TatA/TatE family subunit [Deltaproteobacteria bacterium]